MKLNTTTRLLAGLAMTTAAFGKTIPNHATANLVLGQRDFISQLAPEPPTATSLSGVTGVVVDLVTRKVFVADQTNSRVLRYSSADALVNGARPEAVLGQPNFNSYDEIRPPTSQSMFLPSGLFLDRLGRLWVADGGRVLRFSAAAQIGSQPAADRVYGQASFTTYDGATTQSVISGGGGVWVDASDRLWVADADNNRVLRFDDITNKPSGANADAVLGQANFTTATSGSGATGFNRPTGLAVSPSGALFVADRDNHRVLRFDNAAGLGNGAPANVVLGQPDFTTSVAGLSAIQMNEPSGLTITQTIRCGFVNILTTG
jgi:DNA-binding beta-propeller fold protein YncE